MKKVNFILLFGLVALFAACSNEDGLVNNPPTDATNFSIDLHNLDYANLSTVLLGISDSEKTVTLNDGVTSRSIQLIRKSNISIFEKGNSVILFDGRACDSISMALSVNYATIRLHKNGEYIGYVAYKDINKMRTVVDQYKKQYSKARVTHPEGILSYQHKVEARSNDGNIACIRLNITRAAQSVTCLENINIACNQLSSKLIHKKNTRSWDVTPPMLEFILLNEEGGDNLEHEVTWQIESLMHSIEFLKIENLIQYYFSIYDIPFSTGNVSGAAAVWEFHKYLKIWDKFAGQGDKVFVLMRSGTWYRNDLGWANDIGVVDINNQRINFEMCAVTTTSASYPHTMAHEMGHLLGAEHVNDKTDLMYAFSDDATNDLHKDTDNINKMRANLTLNE